MNRKILYLTLVLVASSIWACQNPHPGFEKNSDGLYYKFHKQTEDGIALDSGDKVTLKMRYYTEDTIYFNSESMPDDFIISMQAPRNSMDLFTALYMMNVGDSASFIMPPDSLLGSNTPAEMDTIDEIFVDVEVLSKKSIEEFEAEQAEKEKENIKKEQKRIEEYLTDNELEAEMTSNGIYILDHVNTSGKQVDSGKVAVITFKGSLLNGTVFQKTSPEFPYIIGQTDNYPFKWDEVLLKMHKGDKAEFILPSNLALGERGAQGIIPPYSPLILEVSVKDIMEKEDYQAKRLAKEKKNRTASKEKLDKYLRENNIDHKPTSSGLIYITKEKGTGDKPQQGETALVHYKGYFLDGEVFDSSYERGRPLEVKIGQGGLIQGWLEAIPMMREGEKAQIIVPWRLAYGKQGKGNIPPYANLVFDLELVKIKS